MHRLPVIALLLLSRSPASALAQDPEPARRPNILLAIADDWGWPHAGVLGDPVVRTPTFDRLAAEGLLLSQAYVSSPSCSASRAALLTGQWHWRLAAAANLYGPLAASIPVYPDLLEDAGYFVGFTRKGWGPGKLGDRTRNPAGPKFKDFGAFLEARPEGQPFCFWFGSFDPHRGYALGSGAESGMDLDAIRLPGCFPDRPEVRSDVADYYVEVQRFDREVGELLAELERRGELDDTLVVMTGDHGMPFPRCKANVYDTGTRVPLAVRWPGHVAPGRSVEDFCSFTDLAPTFLRAAGLVPPSVMTGRSLVPLFEAEGSGWLGLGRTHVLTGKERHVPCQQAPDTGGTPMRALRTREFLYVRNFRPDRWPAGTPDWEHATISGSWYGDCDNGPTKTVMVEDRERDAASRRLYDLAFALRPAEELYDLAEDPNQLVNVAALEEYSAVRAELSARLEEELTATGDPRLVGGGERFDAFPYTGGSPRWEGR
ncbi:MAG: sulfatase [Planctomycetota bacterium]